MGPLQAIKVAALRAYFRHTSSRGWHGGNVHAVPGALEMPTGRGPVRAHLYRGSDAAAPLIVFFHGGGWVLGDLQTHHPFCSELAARSGCSVVSVDYRLAPEHPYPAALEDCLAACRWLQHNSADLGPSDGRLLLAGDSAGGNLAACCALQLAAAAADPAALPLCGLLLIYPALDHYSTGYVSYRERARGQRLTSSLMRWFWNSYLDSRRGDDPALQAAFPLRADNLDALPPTLLVTAEYDPLRDEGLAFLEKARRAGVPVTHYHYDGAEHGFACSMGLNAEAQQLLQQAAAWRLTL
jgi:acetyl esterase